MDAERRSGGQAGASNAALFGALALGVAAIGAAAIFIRLAEADALTIAAGRMVVGAGAVGAFALVAARGQFAALRWEDAPWLLLAGAFLAAHFAAWIASLHLTSLANSVFLVTTTPVFAALGSHFAMRDRVGGLMAFAVALSVAGGLVLAAGEAGGAGHFGGDALAAAGAVAMGGNLLVGRKVRRRVPFLPYVTVVYAAAAAMLCAAALASGARATGLPADAYLWIALAGLIPQAVGHSTLNWALAHAPATTVAMSTRGEPIIATLLAIPVLGEVPPWTILPGGALLFAGVALAVRSEMRARG